MQMALARWQAPRAAEEIADNILNAVLEFKLVLAGENRLKAELPTAALRRTETGTRWRRMNTILEMATRTPLG